MVKPFLHGVHLKNKMNTMGIYLNIMGKTLHHAKSLPLFMI